MRILLDTHAWLWAILTPERFSHEARELIESPDHELYLSAASAWEISIKTTTGKLRLPDVPERYVPSRMANFGVHALDVTIGHALRVGQLPPHHADPFDRLLVAQAQLENLPILTADPVFNAYDVELIPA